MSEEITYNLDEIMSFKASLPEGIYEARLTNVNLGATQKGDPVLEANFEIISGESSGEDVLKKYYLVNFITKKGAKGNNGISEFRSDATAIGELSKVPRQFTAVELKKLYAKLFLNKKIRLKKFLEKDSKGATNEDGSPKLWAKFKILGLVQSTPSSTDLSEFGL